MAAIPEHLLFDQYQHTRRALDVKFKRQDNDIRNAIVAGAIAASWISAQSDIAWPAYWVPLFLVVCFRIRYSRQTASIFSDVIFLRNMETLLGLDEHTGSQLHWDKRRKRDNKLQASGNRWLWFLLFSVSFAYALYFTARVNLGFENFIYQMFEKIVHR